ncbi:MAG: alpha/beta hydrolase [Flavobacteriaceae bacterium]|nr:alpha/beta hydrolase [Flavobacteriaceae bacterium]
MAIFYCLALLGLYFFQERLLFQSVKLPQDFNFKFEKPFTEINLKTEDNATLNGLYFELKNPKGVILFFHGNRDNLVRWGTIASGFTKYNYNVLVVDYRGYGKSTGKRSETKLYQDAHQWYTYVNQMFDESKIVVYGRSLGATFATYVAYKNKPAQLILEAPFNSLVALPKYWFKYAPYDLLLKYHFNSQKYIKEVPSKITIFHGTKDRVIPIKLGQKLFKSAPKNKAIFIVIDGGKHNNLATFDKYHKAVKEILN